MDKKTLMVVPCFNEAHRFPIDYWKDMIHSEPSTHWIFVNDGSSDTTSLILEDIVKGSTAELVNNKKNLGKGNSIRQGFNHALGQSSEFKTFGYIDSDGAFSHVDLKRLIEMANELQFSEIDYDAILSSRVALAGRQINRNPVRHYIGRLVATFLTKDWADAPYDTQSGLKLFPNSTSFQTALTEPFKTKWFADIEILTRIGIKNGGSLSLWEEPLTSWSDISGSKLNFKHAPKLFREMFLARKEVSRFVKTMRFSNGSN